MKNNQLLASLVLVSVVALAACGQKKEEDHKGQTDQMAPPSGAEMAPAPSQTGDTGAIPSDQPASAMDSMSPTPAQIPAQPQEMTPAPSADPMMAPEQPPAQAPALDGPAVQSVEDPIELPAGDAAGLPSGS